MVVPHGTDGMKSWSVSERALQALMGLAGGAFLLVLFAAALTVLFAFTPTARSAARDNAAITRELTALHSKVTRLQDTIAALGKRDEKIRLLAGLEAPTDTGRVVAAGEVMDSSSPRYDRTAGAGQLVVAAKADIDALIRRANTLSASFAVISDTLANHMDRMAKTPSIMPTAGWMSSHFSRHRFHPILHVSRPHDGIDLSAPMGAPIIAPAGARVIRVSKERGYGNVLELDHGNGIVTKYAHCSRILVRAGQQVIRGQTVATVGNTGLSTGPHLHYEIHVYGKVVDPLSYVLPGAIPD
ncbi:MAG: M23 family metallopeptidase [Gemmatimonadaceae bacterium]